MTTLCPNCELGMSSPHSPAEAENISHGVSRLTYAHGTAAGGTLPYRTPPAAPTIAGELSRQLRHLQVKSCRSPRSLTVVLLLAMAVSLLVYGWYSWAASRENILVFRQALAPGQTIVRHPDGAAVDFGRFNSMNGELVSICRHPTITDSAAGGMRTVYSITAGNRTSFTGLITITLPYDISQTDAKDTLGSIVAEYHNPRTGQWELVDYKINTQNHTVAITTDHLSDYCLLTFSDAGSPQAKLIKLITQKLDKETAMSILREYAKGDRSTSVSQRLLYEFYRRVMLLGPPESLDKEDSKLVGDILGWLTDAGELAAQGGGYQKAAQILEKSGYMLLGLSALSLGDTMMEAYRGESSAEEVAAEAYKLAYDVSLATMDYKQITTGMVQLSMLGVIAIDYSLNKYMRAANQTYKDALFKVVVAYNEEIHPWTDKEWFDRIMALYKKYEQDPKKFSTSLRAIMENYSARYFLDNPEEQLVATNQAGLHAYTTGLLPETIDAKNYCIQQYVARLGKKLQPTLGAVAARVRYDANQSYLKNVNELRHCLNSPLELRITQAKASGQKSPYAYYTAIISRPNGATTKSWRATLDVAGRYTFQASILGYLQAGVPTRLSLWAPNSNPAKDAPVLTKDFTVSQKVTTITVGKNLSKVNWFAGRWSTQPPSTSPYPDVIIKILNDKECSYFIALANTKMEPDAKLYTTSPYVFDPVERTLIIKKFYHYKNGLKIFGYDKPKDGESDCIIIRRGENYESMAAPRLYRMR